MAKGTVRYWAAAKAAAGVGDEPYDAARSPRRSTRPANGTPVNSSASCGDARS